jgi:hypothetical protein
VGQDFRQGVAEFRPLIATVGKQLFKERIHPEHAGYAFETKRRKLEHQFEMTNSELREEYLAAVLEIHDSPEAKITGVTH